VTNRIDLSQKAVFIYSGRRRKRSAPGGKATELAQ
jgi:hypothetical protein